MADADLLAALQTVPLDTTGGNCDSADGGRLDELLAAVALSEVKFCEDVGGASVTGDAVDCDAVEKCYGENSPVDRVLGVEQEDLASRSSSESSSS